VMSHRWSTVGERAACGGSGRRAAWLFRHRRPARFRCPFNDLGCRASGSRMAPVASPLARRACPLHTTIAVRGGWL
jgi:hypothetical protein